VLLAGALTLVACARTTPEPADLPRPVIAPAAFVFGDAPPGEFVSKRFGLRLRLPDGKAWRIDDHKTEHLVATHTLAATSLRAARFNPNALSGATVTRATCWDEAIARSIFPLVSRSESVVENEERYDGTADTHVAVSIGRNGRSGYVRYVAGSRTGCVALGIESTRLAGDTDETLADRLALLREKSIGGLAAPTREPLRDERSWQPPARR